MDNLWHQERMQMVMWVVTEAIAPGKMSNAWGGSACSFPLRCVVVEVRDQANAERIGVLQAFDNTQVPSYFSQTFAKS